MRILPEELLCEPVEGGRGVRGTSMKIFDSLIRNAADETAKGRKERTQARRHGPHQHAKA